MREANQQKSSYRYNPTPAACGKSIAKRSRRIYLCISRASNPPTEILTIISTSRSNVFTCNSPNVPKTTPGLCGLDEPDAPNTRFEQERGGEGAGIRAHQRRKQKNNTGCHQTLAPPGTYNVTAGHHPRLPARMPPSRAPAPPRPSGVGK